MPMRRPSYGFDTDDRKVYFVWLRSTVAVYGAMVLFGVALIAVQAMTRTANTVEFAASAVTMTGP
jgi:hypothetical protein